MDGQSKPDLDLGELSLPELAELMHRITDEIVLRMMQNAGSQER